jgi:regulator of protease activity HflC (stomatin/prohibitin superfamily)
MQEQRGYSGLVFLCVMGFVLFIALLLFGWPVYKVWQQGLSGEARLARATQERQILVQQAQAEVDAAELRAEAIAIVGQAAKEFPEYRQQEFIGAFAEALQEGRIDQIIYVPTETNIPIMEAGKR